jgi:hypothetical protein
MGLYRCWVNSPRLREAASVGLLLVVVLLLTVRAASLINVPGEPSPSRWVLHDFRDALYYPVVSFLGGGNPYDEVMFLERYPVLQAFPPYSPLTLLVHVPFGLLPHQTAQLIFYGYSLLLTLLLGSVALWICGRRLTLSSICLLSAVALMSRPGYSNLLLGQTTLELVLAVYVSLFFASTRPGLSGLGLVLASMKPTFGVPLAILLLAQRSYRAVAVGISIGALLTMMPILVIVRASGGPGAFAASLLRAYRGIDATGASSPVSCPARVDVIAVVGHWAQAPASSFAVVTAFVVVMAMAAAALLKVRQHCSGRACDLYCISLVSLAVLVSIYHQVYCALLLVIPLTTLAIGEWIPAEIKSPNWVRWVLLGLLSVPAVNYGASYFVTNRLETGSVAWIAAGSVNGVALAVAFFLLTSLPHVFLPTRDADQVGAKSELGC